MPGTRKIRYAVVGAGWISQAAFMPGVAHTGNSEITALVTGDPEKATVLGQRYGVANTFHYDAWPAAIASGLFDAVYLALSNWMHRDFAIPALEAGLHVLLEKPMATSEADCRAIEAAAAQGNAKLMLAYRLHFEPATLEAIRLVRDGALGPASLFVSAFTQHVAHSNHRARHGFWAGPVADMAPYPINAVRNLFAAEPIQVMAWGTRNPALGYGFDDTVAILLRFPGVRAGDRSGNRLAQLTVAYGLSPASEYRIIGPKGYLVVNPGYAFPGPLAHRLTLDGKTTERIFPKIDQFGGETQYFSNCILHDRAPEPDGEEGRLDVRIVAAIEQALATGRPQDLEPLTRSKRPDPSQATTLASVTSPKLTNAAEPSED